jgi:hypothetical protein
VIAVPSIVAETVIISSIIELTAPVATPFALVGFAGWVRFAIPVAASTTVAPLIGFPLSSNARTVIVADPLMGTIDVGAATTVDWLTDTGPGDTVTVAVWVSVVPLAFAETVFAPAAVEETVPVATPLGSVTAPGCVTVFPVPVADSSTVAPLIG